MGAHGDQISHVLGAFAQAIKADYDALCTFRLCLLPVYDDEPQTTEGGPGPAQRRRIPFHIMSQNGSFAMPRIESFLLPCHADPFMPDLTVRRTLTTILNLVKSERALLLREIVTGERGRFGSDNDLNSVLDSEFITVCGLVGRLLSNALCVELGKRLARAFQETWLRGPPSWSTLTWVELESQRNFNELLREAIREHRQLLSTGGAAARK
jgi:hypothetical protein